MNELNCRSTQALFSSYLDGAVSGHEMQAVAEHLRGCPACSAEFSSWRSVQSALATCGQRKAPADLGLKLRVAISQEAARQRFDWRERLAVRWDNLLRPALVQVSAGLAGTIVLVGGLAMLVGAVAAPQPVMANDEPLAGTSAPRYSYSLVAETPVIAAHEATVVVDAKVNAEGAVYDYTVLSGPQDAATLAEVRHLLLLQVYTPARVLGTAVSGNVLVTFSAVQVRG